MENGVDIYKYKENEVKLFETSKLHFKKTSIVGTAK